MKNKSVYRLHSRRSRLLPSQGRNRDFPRFNISYVAECRSCRHINVTDNADTGITFFILFLYNNIFVKLYRLRCYNNVFQTDIAFFSGTLIFRIPGNFPVKMILSISCITNFAV